MGNEELSLSLQGALVRGFRANRFRRDSISPSGDGQASVTPVRLLHVVSSPSFPPSINHTSICSLSKEQQGKLLTLCAFWGDIRL